MRRIPSRLTVWSLATTAGALAGLMLLAVLSLPATAAGASRARMVTVRLQAVPAAAPRISLRSTSVGKILVGPNGHTLYAFTRDRRRQDRCVKIAGCTGVWPLVTTHGRPRAGRGVKRSRLGTIRVGRMRQVTYAGHPLYTYISDSRPGETDYVGVRQFGGAWPAVRASGRLVR